MTRCRICEDPRRPDIDLALLDPKTSAREVARTCGLSPTSVRRHRAHIHEALKREIEAERAALVPAPEAVPEVAPEIVPVQGGLLSQIRALQADALRIARSAEAADDHRAALSGIRELTRIVELLAKLEGQLHEAPTVNVAVLQAPEWHALRARILAAVAPFPEARAALCEALNEPCP